MVIDLKAHYKSVDMVRVIFFNNNCFKINHQTGIIAVKINKYLSYIVGFWAQWFINK